MPDLEPFQSPIDGSEIRGRRAMREHFKQHNVTNSADYKNEWATKAKERERVFTPGAGFDKQARVEAIRAAVEKHSKR